MARISDQHIIDAALEVFAQHGYAGSTTRQIADAAGINEVTLFRRFGSKQNLLNVVVEQEAEHFKTSHIEYTRDLEGDLARIVTFYRNLIQQRGHVIMMLMSEIPRQPELLEIMQTPLIIVGQFREIIHRYQREGLLADEDPMQAFLALVGPIYFYNVARFLLPNLDATNQNVQVYVQRYLQGHAGSAYTASSANAIEGT